MMPKFSVILPTHNGEDRIGVAITSVQMQTYTDYELIVVCDSCTDDTVKYVENMYIDNLNDPHIKIITTDVHRDGLARNVGLDAATGEWILFLDDDDHFMHEYCFELLAEKTEQVESDVIDFGFVWKGKGYMTPRPQECFVMAWCRAWRREFIGDNRFCDKPYGSDKEFYETMILNNPSARVSMWNMLLYYYNYMREDSLSWMERKHATLGIIVTHYNEPWELCKNFFDMLECQRCVDFNKIRIIFVQDGKDSSPSFESMLDKYSYDVDVIVLDEHEGTAMARNAGLEKCESDWVMFCNCDDMFADVCSLNMMTGNFPTEDYDVIWMKVAKESKWFTGCTYINKIDEANFSNTDGKMYRRKFLSDHNITFLPEPRLHYDHMFNTIVLAEADPFRVCTLTTDFYPYYKTLRIGSLRHTLKAENEMINTAFQRDLNIINELRNRNIDFQYRRSIAKAIFKEYCSIYNPNNGQDKDTLSPGFLEFYTQYRHEFKEISPTEYDAIHNEAETETLNTIQNLYNEHKQEYYFRNDNVSFEQWLNTLDARLSNTEYVPSEFQNDDHHDGHIVVYCGTYDAYMNMMASAKSLLCNTPVDKIYFLIEDDTFPYELPDVIQTINVSNQTYFPNDGPNYNNAWTWMCMIRAAYPELFPQYSKILSLDIDVVINDNVSDLWDYDISDYYLAGVPEPQRQKSASDPVYINFGVVMMNLDKLRQDNIQEQVIHLLNTQKVDCPEQGAYNKTCAGHILPLPADYNYTVYSHITGDAQKERIMHYAGQRFWRHYASVKQYADLDWDTVMERQAKLHE